MKKIYRKDVIRAVSKRTGFTIEDITYVLEVKDEVMLDAITQGMSIKDDKLMQFIIEEKPKKKAWDGFNKTHYYIPKKKVVKMKPLSKLNKAVEELNKKED